MFSPDSSQLVALDDDNLINLWDGEKLKFINCKEQKATCLIYVQNGKQLAASYQKCIKLLNSSDLSQIQILEEHTENVNKIAFQPNGDLLASCSEDSTIKLWSMKLNQKPQTLRTDTKMYDLHYSCDGQTLISLGNKLILIWDVKAQKQLRCVRLDDFDSYAFSFDGKLFAQSIKSEIQIMDLTIGKVATVLQGSLKNIKKMVFQPGDQILASISEDEDQIKLWDAKIEKNKSQFEGHEKGVVMLAFSPDGTKLASWDKDASLRIWNIRNGKLIAIIEKEMNIVELEFSQNKILTYSGILKMIKKQKQNKQSFTSKEKSYNTNYYQKNIRQLVHFVKLIKEVNLLMF